MSPVKRVSESLERLLDDCGIASDRFEWIDGAEMPQPYRRLLVHQKDMTSTLQSFHQSRIGLKTLRSRSGEDCYRREVVLFAESTQGPVEYGAIEMRLENFNHAERNAILSESEPLGAILNRRSEGYVSDPHGYFSLVAPVVCQLEFGCERGTTLYGRYNQLFDGEGRILASIVEILPPARGARTNDE